MTRCWGDIKLVTDPDPDYSCVYFITDTASRAVKIGLAKNPVKRLQALQVGNPNVLVLMAVIHNVGREKELDIQSRLKHHHVRGEWFELNTATRRWLRRHQLAVPLVAPGKRQPPVPADPDGIDDAFNGGKRYVPRLQVIR